MRRREIIVGPLALYGVASLRGGAMRAANLGITVGNRLGVKALAFDVFGTVVDWRGSIIREGQEWGRTKSLQVDWAKFADRWREGYMPMMDKVRKGTLPWMKLDALHRMILDDLLVESFELLNGPKMALAKWASGLHDLVLPAHKRIQIVAQYFVSDRF
jgi:hypothetical protein